MPDHQNSSTPPADQHVDPPKHQKERIFFPNLDGLRFFCFLMVFLFHVWYIYFETGKVNGITRPIFRFLFQNGELGVNFFFVLSGFLITYLLIKEKTMVGRINVPNFYVRRILRIWPLFYLIVLFGIVVYPTIQKMLGIEIWPIANPWTYFVFLNNFDFMENGGSPLVLVLWSVAVEEQFYLCWPIILSLTPLRRLPWVLFTIVTATLIFRSFHVYDERVLLYHTLSVIGDMAVGGLAAYYSIFSRKFKNKIENLPRLYIVLVYMITIVFALFRKDIFAGQFVVFERIIYSILFGAIILEQNFSKNSIGKFESLKRISKWGIYTYGFYCIHMIIIYFLRNIVDRTTTFMQNQAFLILLSIIALMVTIFMGTLSYNYFEKKFLKLKDRFAVIVKH
ncbi:MAG: acyltransferase [Chitinophagaceae bacterium]|nr:acyltransferase [Chitinophagaceae bacterium]